MAEMLPMEEEDPLYAILACLSAIGLRSDII